MTFEEPNGWRGAEAMKQIDESLPQGDVPQSTAR